MPHRWQVTDSRSRRRLLDPEVFLKGSNPPPSDLLDLEIWDYLMHLADHASITTSNHHGRLLQRLFNLERGWVDAIGDINDWMSTAMVDVMDDLHASQFLLLHGFYRQAIATLRSVLESTLAGAYLQLARDQEAFRRWRAGNEFGFGQAADSLPRIASVKSFELRLRAVTHDSLLAQRTPSSPGGWVRRLYAHLCEYTHPRPGHTNADLWRSNGPIYVRANISRTAALYAETYAVAIIIVALSRPNLPLEASIPRGFERSRAKWARLARACHSLL